VFSFAFVEEFLLASLACESEDTMDQPTNDEMCSNGGIHQLVYSKSPDFAGALIALLLMYEGA
jgi:hypothetical protein